MKLGIPPERYSQQDQSQMRAALEQANDKTHKKGANIEVGSKNAVIFTDNATDKRYPLVVTNGALTLGAAL